MLSKKARHKKAYARYNVNYKTFNIQATLESLGMHVCLGGNIIKKNKEEMTRIVRMVVTSGEEEAQKGFGGVGRVLFLALEAGDVCVGLSCNNSSN